MFTHYNILLRVYIVKGIDFDPAKCLKEIKNDGIEVIR